MRTQQSLYAFKPCEVHVATVQQQTVGCQHTIPTTNSQPILLQVIYLPGRRFCGAGSRTQTTTWMKASCSTWCAAACSLHTHIGHNSMQCSRHRN